MKISHGLILAALLMVPLTSTAVAQDAPPVDRLKSQAFITPAVGGWFSSQTNFGGVSFDIIYDKSRPVVAGSWARQVNGDFTDVFIQSEMRYSTHDEALATGIIASFDSQTYTFTGRGDYADPVWGGEGVGVATGRSIRMEFTSSREGTFIDNPGKPDERRFPVVATVRGLPLVAETDYSGEWLVATRSEALGAHYQYAGIVNIQPYTGPDSYDVVPLQQNLPPSGVPAPNEGARRYEMTCAATGTFESPCEQVKFCYMNCQSGRDVSLLWMNPNEKGSFAGVTAQPSKTVLYNIGWPSMVAYGDVNSIVIRAKRFAGVIEMHFTRLPAGVFNAQGTVE